MPPKRSIAEGTDSRVSTDNSPGFRILVVDDDRAGRLAVTRVLDRAGYGVEAVVNVDSALDTLSRSQFDLVISDLRMPDRSGLDLLAKVHRLQPDLPFLILSAAGDRDSRLLALRRGASDFLEKPVRLQTLLRTIEGALGV